MDAIEEDRFLRAPEVCRMTGYSKASLYRLEAKGEFPDRFKLGPKASAWKLSEIREWMASRARASAA